MLSLNTVTADQTHDSKALEHMSESEAERARFLPKILKMKIISKFFSKNRDKASIFNSLGAITLSIPANYPKALCISLISSGDASASKQKTWPSLQPASMQAVRFAIRKPEWRPNCSGSDKLLI